MTAGIRIRRKNSLNVFREGRKAGNFDEFPVLRPEIDPQAHLSHNTTDQPFYLTCEKDSILIQLSGRSKILFPEGAVRFVEAGPGDFTYIPDGTTHRLNTIEEGLVLRYKAQDPGLESISWFCPGCGDEVSRLTWNASETLPQLAYREGCETFNADVSRRTCKSCGTVLDPVSLDPFRWKEVADALSEES